MILGRRVVLGIVVSLCACGDKQIIEPPDNDDSGGIVVDKSDEIFDKSMLTIDVSLASDDLELLRNQHRPYNNYFGREDCHESPVEHSYDYVSASLQIDGETVDDVSIRKKGFIGSQTNIKPSIKVQFNRNNPSARYRSMSRLTLNNVRSDPSHMRTCLAYHIFEQAGVPASRCTFAKVRVNGNEMGVYAVVEEVKKDYLSRRFESNAGSLYEATINDFRRGFTGFEREGQGVVDLIDRATVILEESSDADLPDDIDQIINLDSFYKYWAAEVMMWQKGGYSGNINNYFLYSVPSDQGRLHFLPWGPDNVMKENVIAGAPDSVLASGLLASRLYEIPETRTAYYSMLDSLLEDSWIENELNAWIDDKANAIRPALPELQVQSFDEDVMFLKNYVNNRKAVIASSRVDGEPNWDNGLYPSLCHVPVGSITARVESTWDTLSDSYFVSGDVEATLVLDDEVVTMFSQSGARVGYQSALGRDRLQFLLDTADQRRYVFSINMPIADRFDDVTGLGQVPLYFPAFSATGSEIRLDAMPAFTNRSFVLRDGTWNVTSFSKTDGGQVVVDVQVPLFEKPTEP